MSEKYFQDQFEMFVRNDEVLERGKSFSVEALLQQYRLAMNWTLGQNNRTTKKEVFFMENW